jgi:enterochelin esterase-like enzyme
MRQPPPAAAATSGRRTVHHRQHLLTVAHHPLHRVASGLAHVPAGLLRQVGRAGPLESPWLALGLGALVPATVALIALSHHWPGRHAGPPRRRWLRRGALAAWLALLSVLAGLAGLNAYVGYVPTLPSLFGDLPIEIGHAAGGGGSSVVSFDIAAPSLRVPPSRCYVYLPPGYRSRAQRSRRYPVVYLLHGYPGGPIDWFRGAQVQETMDALLADRLVQPMILVAPDASGGWLHDSEMLNQVGGPQVESYLVGTVVHTIDRRFRTIADRTGRAIGGMSSGGYGALNLGLRHQDVFSVILSLMPYGTPGTVTRTLLGGSHALWLANSPAAYIPTMAFHHPMAVELMAGDHDPEAKEAARLARMLRARGQYALFSEVHGAGHTWRAARVEAPYVLAFASGHLAGWESTRGMT